MSDNRTALRALIHSVGPLDDVSAKAAAARQDQLTKPNGSLGRLEALSVQLAGITGKVIPEIDPPVIIVFAADHGVAWERGVSAYPPEVTGQMVLNYAAGGAVVCVLGRHAGARVVAVDIGVKPELPQNDSYVFRRIKNGTDDWSTGSAMSEDEALAAILVGAEVVGEQASQGLGLLALGEMGIGNTTTSSALLAALLGLPAKDVTGYGTGIDETQRQHKIAVIEQGLERHADVIRSSDPLAILSALGGLELAGMIGAMIAAASRKVPVIVDGFICAVSALLACRLCPAVKPYLIPSHRSREAAQILALAELGLEPIIDLQMRLGEGSAAALVIPIVRASVAVLRDTATFAEASVSNERV